MIGASIVIGGVGIGVGVCRRLVVFGITNTGIFYTDEDWVWVVSCWMGISSKELTSASAECLAVPTKDESDVSLRN
ncbi:hypothetical protein Tco_1007512 [Tanacetum coccineum]